MTISRTSALSDSRVARGGALHPLVELTLARLREFVREPEVLFWAFLFPVAISVALAMASPSGGDKPVQVGIVSGPAADRIRQALGASSDIRVRDITPAEELRALREGDVNIVVVPGEPPTYRFDPARTESRTARLLVDDVLKRSGGRTDPWRAKEDPVVVPGSRYVDWLVPGIIGAGIMSNGMWSIGFMIVQARLRKLLKRLVASPMRKSDYLLAQLIARLLFLGPEVAVPLAFGVFALGVPFRGSIASVAVVSLAGAFTFGALGLLVGSRVKTIEAVSGLMNLTMVPMWVASGVFFSATNFPAAIQPLVQLLPLTILINALRAVILEGATLQAVRGELALLAVWTVVPFVVALRIFRWR